MQSGFVCKVTKSLDPAVVPRNHLHDLTTRNLPELPKKEHFAIFSQKICCSYHYCSKFRLDLTCKPAEDKSPAAISFDQSYSIPCLEHLRSFCCKKPLFNYSLFIVLLGTEQEGLEVLLYVSVCNENRPSAGFSRCSTSF